MAIAMGCVMGKPRLHSHIHSTLGLHSSIRPKLSQFLDDAMRAAGTPSKTKEETTDNGWSTEMEREMAGVVPERDTAEYMRLSKLAHPDGHCDAIGGSTIVVGVVAGAFACVVNSFSHGGQVWMVFEMYKNNVGFYQLLDRSLSFSLDKPLAEREHAELVETRLALQLGRSISSLRNLASSPSSKRPSLQMFLTNSLITLLMMMLISKFL
ncbi:hypothetical protein AMTRI_Chr01g108030 [Amborella trichopoda]